MRILFLSLLLLIASQVSMFGQDVIIQESNKIQATPPTQSFQYVDEVILKPGFSVSASNGSWFVKRLERSNAPQDVSGNFIRVESILKEGITNETAIPLLSVDKKATLYEYLDGTGRSIQKVNVQNSISKNDVISFNIFDEFGRVLKEYLPFTSNNLNNWGGFETDAVADQKTFYGATTHPSAVASDNEPFTFNEFNNSPQNQVLKSYAAGWNWHNDIESKPKITTNRLNKLSEVMKFNYYGSGFPSSINTYLPNELQVVETTDEVGLIKRTFQNFKEQVVMEQTGSGTVWHSTYFIYDYVGNLVYVFPPEAMNRFSEYAAASSDKQDFLNRWGFQYQYDEYNRLVSKRIPGADWIYMIYDNWDRLVFIQDGEQRKIGKWSYTKYDIFNRPIITGIIAGVKSTLESTIKTKLVRFETRLNNSLGYSNTAYPTHVEADMLTITYYDDYAFLGYTNWDELGPGTNYNYLQESGFLPFSKTLTTVKGYATGTKVKILGSATWLNGVTYYDGKYNAVQSVSENHLGYRDRISSDIDFAGRLVKSLQNHSGPEGSLRILKELEYDHAGRMMKIYKTLNSTQRILHIALKYNELGQIIEKNLHSADNGLTFLQSVDYRYNIQGWITNINNSSLTNDGVVNDDSNDLFGMDMVYNQEQFAINGTNTVKLYNGNISAIRWKTNNLKTAPVEQVYGFSYDPFSRMLQARYATKNGALWNGNTDAFNEGATYDNNGNILTLKRYAKINSAATITDNLTYHYASIGKSGSNALRHVYDQSAYWSGGSQFGYSETDVTHANFVSPTDGQNNTEYDYDANGNLFSDLNKGIIGITYNHLNLPVQIQLTGGRIIDYTYDALGNKLKEVARETSPAKTLSIIDYVEGFQYQESHILSFPTEAGRVVKNSNGFEYEYFIKDHQNNLRVAFGSVGKADNYLATMETARSTSENLQFSNITRDPTFNHTPKDVEVPVPNQATKLNAFIAGGTAIGPAKTLIIKAGDNIQAEVFGRYTTTFAGPNTLITNLVSAVTSALNILPTGENPIYNAFNAALPGRSALINSPTNYPKAYLFYIIFEKTGAIYTDRQFGYFSIDGGALNNWQQLKLDIHVPDDFTEGFISLYVANETKVNASTSVYFDDFSIVHQSNQPSLQVLQTSDYYPFGLSFNSYTLKRNYVKNITISGGGPGEPGGDPDSGTPVYTLGNVETNKNLFQEQELENNFDLNWYQYKFRMHDPALGRFGAVDPLSEKYRYNSPYAFSENRLIDGIELEGAEFQGQVAALSSLYGSYVNSFSDDIDGGYTWGALSMGADFFGGMGNWMYDNTVGAGAEYIQGGLNHANEESKYENNIGEYNDENGAREQDLKLRYVVNQSENISQSLDGLTRYTSFFTGAQTLVMGGLTSSIETSLFRAPQFTIGAARGGTQFTKSSLSLGRQMHTGYKSGLADGINTFKEFTKVRGIRPDYVDFTTKTIYELKPFNPRGIQLGTKQLNNYKSLFEQKYGGTWNTILDFY